MAFRKDLMIPKNIEDLITDRDIIIKNLADIDRIKNKTQELCKELGGYVFPVQQFRGYNGIESLTRDVDRRMWRLTMEISGFNKYMDKIARQDFTDSLDKNPPAFTIENVRTTLLSSYNQADEFMKRGIVQLFRNLGAQYKTNDAFKVSKKIILRNWFTVFCGDLSVNYNQEPEMNDLDRVVRTIDGVEFKEHAFSGAMRKVISTKEYEDEYFKIKAFKNGNAHLWLKRDDITDKINDIIAAWYGDGKLASAQS
mgnify:CR=1 FL=1